MYICIHWFRVNGIIWSTVVLPSALFPSLLTENQDWYRAALRQKLYNGMKTTQKLQPERKTRE